jgi:hypothetical protein
MTRILRIAARSDGYRRCGVAHPAAATDHAMGRFSAEQIERMKADPNLYVHEVDLAAPEAEDPADAAGANSRAAGKGGKRNT